MAEEVRKDEEQEQYEEPSMTDLEDVSGGCVICDTGGSSIESEPQDGSAG